ncbi:hypothetical protein BpHYR1_010891 [Brachionus plicatilis]|uniref:Uncharacterized protein n=1 Tax=Brachionus plicatilis TaxID=10195 RepID=A0A3M7QVX4_BRAPC|nr:hypothetical protein BpHYR1_010891 [Brachionus plicatilis]
MKRPVLSLIEAVLRLDPTSSYPSLTTDFNSKTQGARIAKVSYSGEKTASTKQRLNWTFHPKFCIPRLQNGGGSAGIWGCISYKGTGLRDRQYTFIVAVLCMILAHVNYGIVRSVDLFECLHLVNSKIQYILQCKSLYKKLQNLSESNYYIFLTTTFLFSPQIFKNPVRKKNIKIGNTTLFELPILLNSEQKTKQSEFSQKN